ncbi:DinB family protein [bacterium]|nr:DinB family protein [bacterium]
MNANEVLIDLLEDNRRRLRRTFDAASDDCLTWQPDPESNSIMRTVWHMARLFDVFLTLQARGAPAEEACWFSQGWAERTGYDPRGLGLNGWGALTGFTLEEAAQVPRLGREQTLTYLDQVYDSVQAYLTATSEEELLSPGAGFGGRYSRYQCIQMPLMDNIRHLGEIYSIRSRWERIKGK